MDRNQILKPEYLDEYKDLEEKNTDSDYSYNEMFLTQSQYKEYKKIDIEGIDFKAIIGKLGKNRTEDRYAKLRIRKNIKLTEKEYLNMINEVLGYKHLPSVYKYSPIYLNVINGNYEEIGNLACPEIAKIALFKKEGIVLINEELTDVNQSIIHREIITVGSDNLLMRYFGDIRVSSLNILLNRNYNVEERLLLLEVFFSHLDILNTSDAIDMIPEKIDELMRFFETKNYEVFLKRLPENESLNLELLKYILDLNLESFKNEKYTNEILLSLNGFASRTDVQDLKTIYLENKMIYDAYMMEREHILENYLVHEFLKNVIPYINKGKLKDLYNQLIVDFIVLKLLLIGNAIYNGRLDEELIVKKIVAYSRFKIDNPSFLQIIESFMKTNNYDSIETLALILNN